MNRLRFLLPATLAFLASPVLAQQDNPARHSDHATKAGREVSVRTIVATPQPPPVVQDYAPAPAMWRLADSDTTIYLFGTYHILPKNFRWRTERFDRAVAEAQELVVETSDSEADTKLDAVRADMMAALKDRPATSTRLTPASQDKWRALASAADIPFAVFDRMPVLFAMMGAGLSLAQMQGSDHEHGVETVLEAEFKAARKPIGSIEDPVTVMRALLSLDETGLIEQLDQDLSGWDGKELDGLFTWDEGGAAPAAPLASEHEWAQGRLTPIFTPEELEEPGVRAIYDALLTDRNRAWTQWLAARLDKPGVVMVAVGAGHFEGADSVLARLSERGLATERVQ